MLEVCLLVSLGGVCTVGTSAWRCSSEEAYPERRCAAVCVYLGESMYSTLLYTQCVRCGDGAKHTACLLPWDFDAMYISEVSGTACDLPQSTGVLHQGNLHATSDSEELFPLWQ